MIKILSRPASPPPVPPEAPPAVPAANGTSTTPAGDGLTHGAVIPANPSPGPAGLAGLLGRNRTLLVLCGVVLVVGAGGLGYLLTSGGGDDPGVGQVITPARTTSASGVRSGAATGSASRTGATGVGPTASGTGSPAASATSTASSAPRNPFGVAGAGSTGTGSTGTGAGPTGTATGATGTTAAPSSAATVTATMTVTATPSGGAASIYLGLYGWTAGGLPQFWVNDVAATPAVGASFGTSFVYTGSSTSGGATCANITYLSTPRTVCPGKVVKVG
jgi:hypothetical protein